MISSTAKKGSTESWLTRAQWGWEYGWGIGLLIIALQMTYPFILPPTTIKGEDWRRYYIVGIWSVAYIGSAFIRIPKQPLLFNSTTKTILSLYALAMAELYCLPDTLDWGLAGVGILTLIWNISFPPYRNTTSARSTYGGLWLLKIMANAILMLCIFSVCQRMIGGIGNFFNPNNSRWAFVGFILTIEITRCFITPRAFSGHANTLWRYLRAIFLYEPHPKIRQILHLTAFYIVMLFCFRTDRVLSSTDGIQHHWKAILEPAESIRAGGWLLWSVPSQYGFLMPLILALLPTADTWESLYWLNGTLLTLSGYMIFFMLFTNYKTYSGYIFSLLLCLSGLTLVQTSAMGDHRLFSSPGALRFIWMYVLVCYVYYCAHWLNTRAAKKLPASHVNIGNALWILGVLWAPESAALSTLIWLPSLGLMQCASLFSANLSSANLFSGGQQPSWPTLFKTLVFTPLAACVPLIGSIVGIVAFYYIQLGHAPDTEYITAYPTAYKAGFGSILVDSSGGVCFLLALFAGGVSLCRIYCANTSLTRQSLLHITVFYITLSSMWMCSSYYVARSHENNIINIIPILVFTTAIILKLMTVTSLPPLVKQTYATFVAVFFSTLIFVGGKTILEKHYYSLPLTFPFAHNISNQVLLPIPPLLKELMDKAGISRSASVFPQALPLGSLEKFNFTAFKPWALPSSLVSYYEPLSHELYNRAAIRALEHGCDHGWVIESSYNSPANFPWIATAINVYYRKTDELMNRDWRIIKYEKKAQGNC